MGGATGRTPPIPRSALEKDPRPGPASILPRDLDPFLCTHLVFAFASMSNNQIVPKDPQDEKILYPEFNKLKERCVHCVCGAVFYR